MFVFALKVHTAGVVFARFVYLEIVHLCNDCSLFFFLGKNTHSAWSGDNRAFFFSFEGATHTVGMGFMPVLLLGSSHNFCLNGSRSCVLRFYCVLLDRPADGA